ncbi:MAG: stage II sporulation protein P [Desulfotomaculaceae bacterium]|nr:stage II sporulation protein P [Desulfotomaculaceae bacterium]
MSKITRIKNAAVVFLIIATVAVVLFSATKNSRFQAALTTAGFFNKETPDHLTGMFTTIVDEEGNMLSMMSRTIFVGDELYTSEGRSYRIGKVQGERAEAKFLGMDPQIVSYNELYAGQVAPVAKSTAEQRKGNIAVYHSHTDESYVPTDGTESIPFKGGIYRVGKVMVDVLQGKGIQVNYDQTPHDPHDNNAYVRSRRTAANLLKSGPAAIFDIHRDGVPDPTYYRAEIDGKKVAKLRLVVGRENPKMEANMDFAKRMMSAANNMHPKVVKEIFVGKGDYNQDLMHTALLIEAGTHTNSGEEAERGVSMFSESVPTVLGITGGTPVAPPSAPAAKPTTGAGGAWKALGWVLGLTVVGGVGYLLIISGNWDNVKKNISSFGREITMLGGRRAARKPGARDESPDRGDDT